MRIRLAALVLPVMLGACAQLFGPPTANFPVFFQPYSAQLDQPAQEAIQNAATFAKRHPLQPVILVGYSAPPDPGRDVAGLSEQRAAAVQTVLVNEGVSPNRISVIAKGSVEPEGGRQEISVRRVDINVGPLPSK
ncbi:OmpA family protein [Rhodopila sp.]|jgi:outer membrane protein OmpA-like peptidoglycan-associated protein|uniref:OmpA family protein n=1 Tax=Rhodopila sp. TaxID=2480087 RepID=UPI002CA40F9F|nr:OmpA family protein [Rhodopila sp.]HVZ09275.1 OmpA family protein [Rhodopila sp.]